MIRKLYPVLLFLFIIITGFLQVSNVSLDLQAPTEVNAGSEFEVRITLNKGDLESFSRFQMQIPAGLIANSYVSSNADFSFSNQRVRFIWLKLPEEDEFTFIYKIKVDERLTGLFSLDGLFSYIDKNTRKTLKINSDPIKIIPSSSIDPSLIVDINDFEKNIIQKLPTYTAGSDNILCIRQQPYTGNANEYIINLLVNKEDKQKFAKIEETVPPGYKAFSIETKNGIFTFKNGQAKFLWMNLPADPYFIVSYKLIPVEGQNPPAPDLKGVFSYLVDEKTISIDILQKESDVKSLSQEQIYALLDEIKAGSITAPIDNQQTQTNLLANNETKTTETKITETKPVENNTTETKVTESKPVETKTTETKVTETKPVETKTTETKTTNIKTNGTESNTIKYTKSNNISYLLEPENGVYYRVQIAAGHKSIDIKRYFKKFQLDKEIRKEEHEGWIKYSVGSFDLYKDARDYRIHIWNTTNIDDAFVSAYNNGKRITVQEALMIANQMWYK